MFQGFWFLIFLIILVLDFWGFCWGVVAYDEGAKSVREGYLIKLEVSQLKSKFGERAQALIPGDLHTHSVIVYRTCSVFVGVTWFVDVTGHAPTMLMLIFDAGNLYGHFQAARESIFSLLDSVGLYSAKQFNMDLTPRKSSIKLMIQEELTKLAEEDDEEEDEEAAGKDET